MDVSLGVLSYDDLAALVIDRPEIAEVVLPYVEAICDTILPGYNPSSSAHVLVTLHCSIPDQTSEPIYWL